MYESITMLPYSPARYRGHAKLWTMVIIRAIYDYAYGKDSISMASRLLSAQAEAWLFRSHGEGSLEEACERLSVARHHVCTYARQVQKKDLKKLRLTERDFVQTIQNYQAADVAP